MARQNLELARLHCNGMRELVLNNPAHWKEEPALEVMRSLCERASAVIADPECRTYLRAIDDYASALATAELGSGWTQSALRRREILRKLQLLSDRLAELEARRAGPAAVDEHDARRRARYAKVLANAAASVGGTGRLALLLAVSHEDLERWIARDETAPLQAFLGALDYVASGARRIRVAALPMPVRHPPQPARRAPRYAQVAISAIAASAMIVIAAAAAIYLSPSARIDPPPAAKSTTESVVLVSVEAKPMRVPRPKPRAVAVAAMAESRPVVEQPAADPCASLNAWSSLWCREQARLEYCEHREGLDPACPSAIPVSPPQ